jgi:hypothetical protein
VTDNIKLRKGGISTTQKGLLVGLIRKGENPVTQGTREPTDPRHLWIGASYMK